MYMFRVIAVNLLMIVSLLIASQTHAATADIRVYKGELRFVSPVQQAADTLLIQYRSRTREVVRINIHGLSLTNTRTDQVISLDDQSASLLNRYDQEGYWITDIYYNDMELDDDNYRIKGSITLYLIGKQRTRNFRVYLNPESAHRPPGSSIDWGINN